MQDRNILQRAYSFLEIKAIDRAQRVIEGIASTPEVDRGSDAMDPMGAQFVLPMPFLWEHGPPVGEVFAADVQPDGIRIKARFSKVAASAPASVRDPIEKAWHSVSADPPLAKGLSIGWSPIKSAIQGGVRRVSQWIWGETSAVVVPMNAHATITSVKSLAAHDRPSAPSGARSISSPSAVADPSRKTAMNISEQLTAAKADLQLKSTRLTELLTAQETNGGLEEAEAGERDTLLGEIKTLTAKRDQFQVLEAAIMGQSQGFTPVPAAGTPRPRATHEAKTVALPKGAIFTRIAMCLAAGRGSRADSMEYAKQWSGTPEVLAYIKAGFYRKDANPGLSIDQSPGWGSELAQPNTINTEFVELLRTGTIIGRTAGFRNVPFNIPIITQTGGSTFAWVGPGAPKPVGELAFDATTLGHSKVAGIIVLGEDLVRLSNPNAEALARNDLVEQAARFLDQQFIQVAIGPTSVSPASITYNLSSPTATGTTAAALRHDLNIALKVFTDAGVSTAGIHIAMTSALARGISLLTTTLGVPEFPTMTPEGGTLIGYPVIVSDSVDAGTVVLYQPREIFLADDGRVTLDASREATLDMSGGSTATFNLWQNNCVGIRAEQWIRWQPRRAAGYAAVIDTAAYAPA